MYYPYININSLSQNIWTQIVPHYISLIRFYIVKHYIYIYVCVCVTGMELGMWKR